MFSLTIWAFARAVPSAGNTLPTHLANPCSFTPQVACCSLREGLPDWQLESACACSFSLDVRQEGRVSPRQYPEDPAWCLAQSWPSVAIW